MTDGSPFRSPCEGCGNDPEVYGSSWCAACHRSIPESAKDRIIELRNVLISVSVSPRSTNVWLSRVREALRLPGIRAP